MYAAAKGLELSDANIYTALGDAVSGHTLKHLAAAGGVACVVAGLKARSQECRWRRWNARARPGLTRPRNFSSLETLPKAAVADSALLSERNRRF